MKQRVTGSLQAVASRMLAATLWCIGKTCRPVGHRDLRPVLKRDGESYLLASFHAHQVGAAMCGDRDIAAMVSRSRDGAMIVPTLHAFGVKTIRGSAGKARKGGATATTKMIRHVKQGGAAFLTVDGPNGPRGRVHRGIAMLARKTGQPVLAIVVRPRRRWVVPFSWDRLQIPKPFTCITVHFSRPLRIRDDQSIESFAAEVQAELLRLERWYDPEEAEHSETPTETKLPGDPSTARATTAPSEALSTPSEPVQTPSRRAA